MIENAAVKEKRSIYWRVTQGFKGIDVNLTLSSLYRGSLEITLTVPVKDKKCLNIFNILFYI